MTIPSRWRTFFSTRLAKIWEYKYPWIVSDVLAPLAITRLALLVVAWFSQYFVPNPDYPIKEAIQRGWQFSPYKLLDVWARWDTGWYLSIVRQGYETGNITSVQSNIVFFPLYPYLVRYATYVVPSNLRTSGMLLLTGVLLSNIFFLITLVLLYKLVIGLFHDQGTARRSIWYLLLFPTSFFFSCFYTEATFLLLCVGAFYAALRDKWAIASLLGCLLALSRPLGVLIVVPLAWIYLEKLCWKFTKIRKDIVWFVFIPIGLFAFLLYAYSLTGDFFAPFHAQAAWGRRNITLPWQTILQPKGLEYIYYVTRIDQVIVTGFIVATLLSFFLLPSASYGIFSILMIIVPLLTGSLQSQSRFLAVVFPAFIVMALAGKWRRVDQITTVTSLSLQVLFFAGWARFYWIA
jgi:Gpi18-like mannosyltransferase